MAEQTLSVRRAGAAVAFSQAAYHRPPATREHPDAPVIAVLNGLMGEHHGWGLRKCFDRLRLDGHGRIHKRVWRTYCGMKLNLPRWTKEWVPRRERQSTDVEAAPNRVWALDFMSDALSHGRRLRMLKMLDEGVREALDIVIDMSTRSGRVVRVLD